MGALKLPALENGELAKEYGWPLKAGKPEEAEVTGKYVRQVHSNV